jgi:excisionase family DNA binding protein
MTAEVRVPRLLRVREVEKLTGIERWRLYEMFKRGEGPPHMKIGATIRVPEDALVKWIEEQSTRKEV